MKFSAHKNRFIFAILSERPCSLSFHIPGTMFELPALNILVQHQSEPPVFCQLMVLRLEM